jgi:hypothetical protein
MVQLLLQLLAFYAGGTPLYAQTVGAASSQLLSQGPGAEAAALGGTVVSTIHDPTALYWNPAGLANAGGMVTGEHLFLFDGARYDFIGLSVPSKFGTFGLGALQLNRDNIVARSAIDDPGYNVSNTQSDYMVGYGRILGEHWSVGATANVLNFNLAGHTDKGWGLDLGSQGTYPQDDFWGLKRLVWSFGASIKNLVEPKLTLLEDTEAFPRELRGGAGLSFQAASRPSVSGVISNDRAMILMSFRRVAGDPAIYPGIGISYCYQNVLVFRLGYDGYASAGAGFHTTDGRFVLDYSMENKPFSLDHRFTISYRFTPAKAQRQETYQEDVDDEYARAKGQADSLAQETVNAGHALFKDQRYREAQEAYRLAALLAPDDKGLASTYRRAVETYRRAEIHRLSTDANLDPAPGQESQAYISIARLLDLGADNKAELAARVQRLAGRIPVADYFLLAQQAFDQRAQAAHRLVALGHIRDAQAIADTLDVLKSSQTALGVQTLRDDLATKGAAIRKAFDDLAAHNGEDRSDTELTRAALALKRAFPDDGKSLERADAALARYRSAYPLSVKERFYLRKLYYLAAMRYVKKQDGDQRYAQDFLDEILRRDAADANADALLDAIAREGVAQQ